MKADIGTGIMKRGDKFIRCVNISYETAKGCWQYKITESERSIKVTKLFNYMPVEQFPNGSHNAVKELDAVLSACREHAANYVRYSVTDSTLDDAESNRLYWLLQESVKDKT